MKAIKLFAFLLALSVLCSHSFAFTPQPTPCVTGATGVVRIPSADILPYKNFNFGLDTGSNYAEDKFALYYKFGIGTFQGMELGCVGMDNRAGMMQEGVFVNMKYSLVADNSQYPLLLAIGVENLASFTRADVYMMATRYLASGSKLHFGFLGDFPGLTNNRFRPLGALGMDTPFFSERIYFLTDMLAGESLYELNVGFRWYANDSISVNLTGINILADDNRDPVDKLKDKDPKSVLIGFSWINPL